MLLVTVLIFWGCGDPNSSAPFNGESGSHPEEWLPSGHASAAKSNIDSCTECHGSDLSGGISGQSCTQCHLGGPESVHPADWGSQAAVNHASYVETNGNSSCSNISCHGSNLGGVAGSGPSCSSCHLGGSDSVHPQDWGALTYMKHATYAASNGTLSCSNAACHGLNLEGISGSGPSCSSCHMGGATSVHPADWSGDAIFSQHPQYIASHGSSACSNIVCHGPALQGVTGSGPSCYACHS
jgi:hypothetical protein